MLIILYVLIGFGSLAALIVTACLMYEAEIPQILPMYRPRKAVGPSFWGQYIEGDEPASFGKIKLPKITFEDSAVVGGQQYAKGIAIKSARTK